MILLNLIFLMHLLIKTWFYPPCVKNIAKEMMTIFLNNIKEHFVQRLKTLVNVVFKDKLLKTYDKNIAYKNTRIN